MENLKKHEINERIIHLMQILNLTPNSFAKRLNVSSTLIYNIEKNRNKPSFDLILAISQTFNVDCNWLILGFGTPFFNSDLKNFYKSNVGVLNETNVVFPKKRVRLSEDRGRVVEGFKETDEGILPIYKEETKSVYDSVSTKDNWSNVPINLRYDVIKRLAIDISRLNNDVSILSNSMDTLSIFKYIIGDIEKEYFSLANEARSNLYAFYHEQSFDYNSYRAKVLQAYKDSMELYYSLENISKSIHKFYEDFRKVDAHKVIDKYIGISLDSSTEK